MPLPSDPVESALAALKEVRPTWTPARSSEVEARVVDRLDRKRRVRRLAGVIAVSGTVAAATAASIVLWQVRANHVAIDEKSALAGEGAAALRFPDGTTAFATLPSSDLRVTEDSRLRRTVTVVKGGARFRVAKIKGRVFRVELRKVVVEVLGTTFTVEEASDRVRVSVEEGRVRVRQSGEWVELTKGEVRLFPSDDLVRPADDDGDRPAAGESAAAANPADTTTGGLVPAQAPPALATNVDERSRRLADRRTDGVVNRAVDGADPRRDRAAAWMRAADAARMSGAPAAALPYLRAVIERFPRDSRAPLAAFTAGLLLLEQLGRPTEAAEMFARVVRLDTDDAPLTEDALAREVDAWRQAGKGDRARRTAAEYLRRYPDGRRANSVRQAGGIR